MTILLLVHLSPLAQVTFKNLASRPYTFHSNLLPYEGKREKEEQLRPEEVQPNQVRQYTLKVQREMAPTAEEFECKAWLYFSSINLVGIKGHGCCLQPTLNKKLNQVV